MRLPPAGVPASYPQMKLPVLDNPALFEKLDTEALFFAFYYMPGTHQQYLAARELKRQSWRYHKQHGAWFQVHHATLSLVQIITDLAWLLVRVNADHVQGTLVYHATFCDLSWLLHLKLHPAVYITAPFS